MPKADHLNIGEAADYLGVHIDTIRRWTRARFLPAWRTPGNHRRYRRADLDAIRKQPKGTPNMTDNETTIMFLHDFAPDFPVVTPSQLPKVWESYQRLRQHPPFTEFEHEILDQLDRLQFQDGETFEQRYARYARRNVVKGDA